MRLWIVALLALACAPAAPPPVPLRRPDAGSPSTDAPGGDAGRPDDAALTTWTLHDVLDDAVRRAGRSDAAASSVLGDGVRSDGTIDLREPAPGEEHVDGWTLRIDAAATRASWYARYAPFDTGTSWPSALSSTPYADLPAIDRSSLPDSPAIVAAAGCSDLGRLRMALDLHFGKDGLLHAYLQLDDGRRAELVLEGAIRVVEPCDG